jgi:hypothetical protein
MSECETTATVAKVRIAELEAAFAVANSKLVAMTKERDARRASYARLRACAPRLAIGAVLLDN